MFDPLGALYATSGSGRFLTSHRPKYDPGGTPPCNTHFTRRNFERPRPTSWQEPGLLFGKCDGALTVYQLGTEVPHSMLAGYRSTSSAGHRAPM